MALILHNTNDRPLGQFDSLDASNTVWLGGEVAVWTHVATADAGGTDQAAADVIEDGYVPGTSRTRVAVTTASTSSSGPPYFLADDGLANYGTLFGVVVGATAGQTSYGPGGGTNLGPNTDAGSGKVTLWMQPGLYGVTLDAVDKTASTGLVPTNTSLAVGSALYYTSAGKLTANSTAVSGCPIVGYLSEFQTNGSLVTSQQFLVTALNSPSGNVSSLQQEKFYQAVFYWLGNAIV